MFDAETTALLRAVLCEVCESVSRYETAARDHVASMILEAASKGKASVDGLKQSASLRFARRQACGIDSAPKRARGQRRPASN